MAIVAVVTALLLAATGCPTPPRTLPPPTGGLRVEGTPASALVTVNEETVGTIGQFVDSPLLLRPGHYRIQVSAEDCFPWYGEVDVDDTVQAVTVDLRLVPQ